MNTFLKFLKFFLLLIAVSVLVLYVTGYDYLLKAVRVVYLTGHSTAFIDDHEYFDNELIQNANPQPWPEAISYSNSLNESLEAINSQYHTAAFLIIKNDSIWKEKYYDSYTKNSITNSFSMAKTFVVTLMQKAIEEGKIKSMEQPVSDFYKEFDTPLGKKLTVGHLASMSSGLDWDESYYSPFSVTTQAYFDNDLAKIILDLKVIDTPGKSYQYLSGNTQLLGMIVRKATGTTLANYLSRNFWQPMGASKIGFWQLDDQNTGLAKAYCCISATARDFARFGKLYKDNGKWNGKQLINASFAKKAIQPQYENGAIYGVGLWLLKYRNKKFFMLRGHLGQYVIVQPEDNLIIVRLGAQKSKEIIDGFTKDIYQYIDETYNLINNAETHST